MAKDMTVEARADAIWEDFATWDEDEEGPIDMFERDEREQKIVCRHLTAAMDDARREEMAEDKCIDYLTERGFSIVWRGDEAKGGIDGSDD